MGDDAEVDEGGILGVFLEDLEVGGIDEGT